MTRIVSLLPAATEIVAALGMSDALAGVTHECDHPVSLVTGLPCVTASSIDGTTPGEIDQQVREAAQQGASLFQLHEQQIRDLRPNILFTQALCDVCAVNEDDVRAIATRMIPPPCIVTLSGTTIDGIFDDIMRVADALDVSAVGIAFVTALRVRLQKVHATLKMNAAPRPRIAVIEWTDPIYAAGHWVPEMIHRAGGLDVLSTSGTHSTTRTVAEVQAAAPELLCIAPCGYDMAKGVAATAELLSRPEWGWVQQLPVWVLDGNAFTSRPGPRIVDGVEVFASVLHPTLFPYPLANDASLFVQ